MRALPSVRSDAAPSPDATYGASMSETALSRRKDHHLDIVLDQSTRRARSPPAWRSDTS